MSQITKSNVSKHVWQTTKVSQVGTLIRGITYSKTDASSSPSKDKLPILRANNINGDLNYEELVYIPKSLIKPEQFIRQEDIVFAMSSGSKHLVGKSAVSRSDFKGSFGAFCAVLRLNDDVNKKYISYIFKGNSFRNLISHISKGVNINNLKREHILDFEFLLPPIEIQDAIVSKIEELFSELDKGIESLKLAQQQLKVYRQSVLKLAFEGRLTNEDVKEGELPEGWKLVSIGQICDPNRKCSYGVLVPGENIKNGIKLIRVGDINENGKIDHREIKQISPKIASKFQRTFLEGNEVLITLVGAIGRTAVVPKILKGANTARAVGVIPVDQNISSEFIEFMLRSPNKIREHNASAHEVARKTLNLEDVVKSILPLPPKKEQVKIVEILKEKLSHADTLEEIINKSLQQAEVIKQSVLLSAFKGNLIV